MKTFFRFLILSLMISSVTSAQNSNSTFEVYGHVMTDAGYQFFTADPNWFDVMRTTKLPSVLGEFEPDGKTYFSVRQTRFGVKSSTPTSIGTLKKFEFENAIIVGAMLNQYIAF